MARRRILFACSECEAALVWPVDDEPREGPPATCLYPVEDGRFAEGADPLGRATYVLHPDRMWHLTVDPSGRARCPEGHPVGTVTTGQNPPPWFIALWQDKVTSRRMRGRV